MTKKEINLYYCDSINFGDRLNKNIFEDVFNLKIKESKTWQADIIGIGSILDRCLLQIRDIIPFLLTNIFRIKKPLYVFSSGFGFDNEHYRIKGRFFKNTIIKRNLNIVALRGKYTKSQIEGLLKKNLSDVVLGDLGLLCNRLIDEPSEKIYDLGICPHKADLGDEIFEKIKERFPNSIILDTKDDPIDFLKTLSKCRYVVSTGLHPIIAADALGIPNLWARISETTTSQYKFYDYYSVFNVEPTPFYLYEKDFDLQYIENNYKVKREDVIAVQEALYNRCKGVLEEKFNLLNKV